MRWDLYGTNYAQTTFFLQRCEDFRSTIDKLPVIRRNQWSKLFVHPFIKFVHFFGFCRFFTIFFFNSEIFVDFAFVELRSTKRFLTDSDGFKVQKVRRKKKVFDNSMLFSSWNQWKKFKKSLDSYTSKNACLTHISNEILSTAKESTCTRNNILFAKSFYSCSNNTRCPIHTHCDHDYR